MSKEKIFQKLISQMTKDGEVSPAQYELLVEAAKDMGIDSESVDLLIKLKLSNPGGRTYNSSVVPEKSKPLEKSKPHTNVEHVFKSAITRGGSVLTPDAIVITNESVTYKKRNKYLINVDSLTIPIANISSVELDTSILGTDIIITSYGKGKIVCRKFTKSDAKKIRDLIQERQGW